MPPNWVFVLPGKAKLEIMSRNSFVNNDRPRILCSGAPEVTKVPGRLAHEIEEHTSELQSRFDLVCRLLLEKKKKKNKNNFSLRKIRTKDINRKRSVVTLV